MLLKSTLFRKLCSRNSYMLPMINSLANVQIYPPSNTVLGYNPGHGLYVGLSTSSLALHLPRSQVDSDNICNNGLVMTNKL